MEIMERMASKGIMGYDYARLRKDKRYAIFRYKVRVRIVADFAKKYLDSTENLCILDFGSAEGATLLELYSLFPSSIILGVEFSDELMQCQLPLPANIKIIKGDVTYLPAKSKANSYDLVTALAILEHLSEPLKALQEAYEVLKPGGIFIATFPSPFWDNASVYLGMEKGEEHETEINKSHIYKLIKESRLDLIVYKRFMWAPISLLPYVKIPVSPSLSLVIDYGIASLKIFDWLFVNQLVVCRKPHNQVTQ